MDQIRAFVGHSFARGDDDVVGRILKLLNRVMELHPHFSWDHAEHPEPRLVDEKVLALFENKTVFIGICTSKERAIDNQQLTRSLLRPHSLCGKADAFFWKTSDWIIQEIGVALGRRMKVILLVEGGVRPPGAMQGNLEVVPFARDFPEAAFDKLLGMIAALSPRPAVAQLGQSESAVAAVSGTKAEAETPTVDWRTPTSSWSDTDFDLARFEAFVRGDESAQRRIAEAFLASPGGAKDEDRRKWYADSEYLKIVFDRGGKLQSLRELADQAPTIPDIWARLARAYEHYDEHAGALEAFQRAIAAETDPLKRIEWLGEAAVISHKASRNIDAEKMTAEARQLGQDLSGAEPKLLEAALDFAKEIQADNLAIGALEGMLELAPDDGERRFQLAYIYGKLEMYDLAAFHYSKVPRAARGEGDWNNLGVAYEKIGLPGRSISAYRKAEKEGGTLAMANLGYQLIDVGFFDEAKELLGAAAAIDGHHPNVDLALSKLKNEPEREAKKEEEILEKARKVSEFYREFGRALIRPEPAELGALWTAPESDVSLSQSGTTLTFAASYEVSDALLSALMGARYGIAPTGKTRYRVEYRGTLRGSTVVGTVSRIKEGESKTRSLLSDDSEPTILMWVTGDRRRIKVMETPQKGAPRFYAFSRK